MEHFTVVCADLRGYGRSGCPSSTKDHEPYSKRVMAQDMVNVMRLLGFSRFSVAGHDRGGRVAYRMALDHPEIVEKLAVLDILPTKTMWDRADSQFALAFWPWSLLAQPEPLPERLLAADPTMIIDNALNTWGEKPNIVPPDVRLDYIDILRNPVRIHAICEEYRAAATIDRQHDADDIATGRRIQCPLLALWSGQSGLASWYAQEGGPLALWGDWSDRVQGHPVEGGHFFPEEYPKRTASTLKDFYSCR
ncbi:alpha/beta hydrolase [Lipomyces starkeyi]